MVPAQLPAQLFYCALCWHGFMEADLQISVKNYRRSKNLKIQLGRVPYSANRQFGAKMNGEP